MIEYFLWPRWLTPARQIEVLEAAILKNGFEKPFFRIAAFKEPYLRDGDSRRVNNGPPIRKRFTSLVELSFVWVEYFVSSINN